MNKITQVSFDVWGTLIEANPNYAKARNVYLAQLFDIPCDETLIDIYRNTKNFYDLIAYEHGIALNSDQVYNKLLHNFRPFRKKFKEKRILIDDIRLEFRYYFKKFPPIVKTETVTALHKLYNAGIKLNIASNTNFISGRIMTLFLAEKFSRNSPNIFEFELYSDQIQLAKPNYDFFNILWEESAVLCNTEAPENILHVGDNENFDGGANQVGIRSFIVNSPDKIPLIAEKIISGEDYFL